MGIWGGLGASGIGRELGLQGVNYIYIGPTLNFFREMRGPSWMVYHKTIDSVKLFWLKLDQFISKFKNSWWSCQQALQYCCVIFLLLPKWQTILILFLNYFHNSVEQVVKEGGWMGVTWYLWWCYYIFYHLHQCSHQEVINSWKYSTSS